MRLTLLFFILFNIGLFSWGQEHDYAKAQYLSTYFLGAQRSGDTDSWIHGPSHLNDGEAVGKDLSGGWYDCGDFIKFHHTGTYAAMMYLSGYDNFPEAYADDYSQAFSAPPSNGVPDILDEVKIQTDYHLKSIDGNTVYYQVGNTNDHNAFNEPVSGSNLPLYGGSSVRPVYTATEGHSNVMGNGAAALALMSILYEPYDAAYAQQCLDAAEDFYAIGQINPAATADPDGFYSFMTNTRYQDEMGLGAIMLYRATGEQQYLLEAQSYATNLSQWDVFNYSSVTHLLYYELYKATGTQSYLNAVGSRVNNYDLESCGYDHLSNWGSLRDAGNASFIAALYHKETGSQSAYNYCKGNIDFILGSHDGISSDAPANFSFLIGYDELGGGYPQNPHHASAFGKSSNAWTFFTQEDNNPGSVDFAYELTGGLAGGPEASCAEWEDRIGNYVSSEYCMYYNSAFLGALAYVNKVENNIISSVTDQEDGSELFEVYANPVKDILHIESVIEGKVEIFNTLGESVAVLHLETGENEFSFASYKAGVYVLRHNDFSIKVIKE